MNKLKQWILLKLYREYRYTLNEMRYQDKDPNQWDFTKKMDRWWEK